MSKNIQVEENGGGKSISEALKRFRRSRLVFEPSLGVLGFFLVGVCLVWSFFYFDYRSVAKSYGLSDKSERFVWLKLDNNSNSKSMSSKRVGFLEESGNDCDVFDGDWVWDESYPLYQSKDCRFLDEGFRCSDFGRSDLFYTHWRWQPRLCNLPR